jgi:hypothetical protein
MGHGRSWIGSNQITLIGNFLEDTIRIFLELYPEQARMTDWTGTVKYANYGKDVTTPDTLRISDSGLW